MNEAFLHHLWQFQRFDSVGLSTTQGESVAIVHRGHHNQNAGPDFLQGAVSIAGKIWHGHIEIHIQSSDWWQHGHQHDDAYAGVVLHVVFVDDRPVTYPDGERIPTIVLESRIDMDYYWRYERFLQSQKRIPCEGLMDQVPRLIVYNTYEKRLVERLEYKTLLFQELLRETDQNWAVALFRFLGYGYGLQVNAHAFLDLLRQVPYQVLMRYAADLEVLEALLFGLGGLFPEKPAAGYPQRIYSTWQFLKHKHGFEDQPSCSWKFHRMRPAAFPTRRVAQFAALLHQHPNLLEVFTQKALRNPEVLMVAPSEYWLHHFDFHKPAPKRLGPPGKDFIRVLQINVLLPFLFYWGRTHQQESMSEEVIQIFREIPPEDNKIIRYFRDNQFPVTSAFDSQALLELDGRFCQARRCLECEIGITLLKQPHK
jgi:hypothetical protein